MYSIALGNYIEVTQPYSIGIGVGTASAKKLEQSNTLAILGYPYVQVGIATATPEHTLQVSGDALVSGLIYMGYTDTTCESGIEGAVRYDTSSHVLQVCSAPGGVYAWKSISASKSAEEESDKSTITPVQISGLPKWVLDYYPSFRNGAKLQFSLASEEQARFFSTGFDENQMLARMDPKTGAITFTPLEKSSENEDSGLYYLEGEVCIGTEDDPYNLLVNGELECLGNFTAYSDATIMGWLGLGVEEPICALEVQGDTLIHGELTVEGPTEVKNGLTIENLDPDYYALTVNGALMTTEGLYRPSDVRLKTDIEELHDSLESLLRLRGVTYKWREAVCEGDARHIGMIAQEVEEVFPQWVYTAPDGYKALSYEGFEALTVEAMRELKTENDELRARLDRLEHLVEDLSDEADAGGKAPRKAATDDDDESRSSQGVEAADEEDVEACGA